MLKIAVFDSGYGGENFADRLERELAVVEVIRVIDWRHAAEIQSSPKCARKCAENALRSYIGRVDIIVFANHLLSITSLKYFRRKYKNQVFLGFDLEPPCSFAKREVLILTTKAVAKTVTYRQFLHQLKPFHIKALVLESWPIKIDDGELEFSEISDVLYLNVLRDGFRPNEVIIACSQFNEIVPELRKILGGRVKFCDGTRGAISSIYKDLRSRGRVRNRVKTTTQIANTATEVLCH